MESTRYLCQISIKLEISRRTYEKCLNNKLHEYPSSANRVVASGRADMTKLRLNKQLNKQLVTTLSKK
jgi:hypothetical protein